VRGEGREELPEQIWRGGESLGRRRSWERQRRQQLGDLGHRRGLDCGRIRERRKRRPPTKKSRLGIYALLAGSPDALYVALDASGDHRTHAQRGMQIGIAPDDGHRTLALASGASGHARLAPDAPHRTLQGHCACVR